MYVWHTAPMQSLDDLKTKEMIVGAQAPGSTQYDYPMLGKALFDLKFKAVTGYKSTSDINLAMERGEVHGTLANWSTVKTLNLKQYEDKQIRMLVVWGAREHPELKGIPLITEPGEDAGTQAGAAACAGASRIRPAVLHAAERPAGTRRRDAARVRRHLEGPGVPRRGGQAQAGDRSDERRRARQDAGGDGQDTGRRGVRG